MAHYELRDSVYNDTRMCVVFVYFDIPMSVMFCRVNTNIDVLSACRAFFIDWTLLFPILHRLLSLVRLSSPQCNFSIFHSYLAVIKLFIGLIITVFGLQKSCSIQIKPRRKKQHLLKYMNTWCWWGPCSRWKCSIWCNLVISHSK